jgi:hypothetical protein
VYATRAPPTDTVGIGPPPHPLPRSPAPATDFPTVAHEVGPVNAHVDEP